MPTKPPADPVWPGMPRARFDQYSDFLRSTADLLGLRDWELRLSEEPATDEDNNAEVRVTFGQRRATVTLARDFNTEPLETQQHCLVHELLHIHFDPTFTLLSQSLPNLIGKTAWTILEEAQREREEHAVDALATALNPLIPPLK